VTSRPASIAEDVAPDDGVRADLPACPGLVGIECLFEAGELGGRLRRGLFSEAGGVVSACAKKKQRRR
jgi:hypothetical protein